MRTSPRPVMPWVERGLWGVALLGAVATGVATVHARGVPGRPLAALPLVADTVMRYDQGVLATAVDSVVATDVFRLARRPARVPFGAPPPPAPGAAAPSRRPSLTLGGIIGGPPWRAVLGGIPNHAGSTIVAPGDTLGGLTVRAIRPGVVIVNGQDTTWTLTWKRGDIHATPNR